MQLRGVAALFVFSIGFLTPGAGQAQSANAPATPAPVATDAEMRVVVPAVRFPEGVTSVQLPVHFVGNRMDVTVTIAGHDYTFMLDSGAGGIFMTDTLVRSLGLTMFGKSHASGVNGNAFESDSAVVPEMRIGRLTMNDVTVHTMPPLIDSPDTAGLIGFDLLVQLGVTIDYEHRRVTAVPSDGFAPPAGNDVHALDVDLHSLVPMVEVSVNGVSSSRFIIDTGAAAQFLIFNRFAQAHPNALPEADAASAVTGYGAGGLSVAVQYRIRDLRLGKYLDFANFTGIRTTDAGVMTKGTDGLFGADFLRYFTVYLAYADSTIYLRRNGVVVE